MAVSSLQVRVAPEERLGVAAAVHGQPVRPPGVLTDHELPVGAVHPGRLWVKHFLCLALGWGSVVK